MLTGRRPWLAALAERCGVLPSFIDTAGVRRLASPATQVAIVEALGFDASTEAAARRSLRAVEDPGELVLAPTAMLSSDAKAVVEVARPAGAGGASGAIEWGARIELESGATLDFDGRARAGRGGRWRLPLGCPLPIGYHRATLSVVDREHRQCDATQHLIVAPETCATFDLKRRPRFGIMTNLYTLRSRRNWGFGDFGDLRHLSAWAAEQGASFIGLNPLSALDAGDASGSPYSPSSRLFGSALYLEIERIPELAECSRSPLTAATLRELGELRAADSIDYDRVWACKRPVLEKLHRVFTRRDRSSRRSLQYERFRSERGEGLDDFATFSALQEMLAERRSRGCDWRRWPAAFRDKNSGAVASFQRANAARIDFYRYLQFETDRQLRLASAHAVKRGAAIGFLQDLPIGVAPGGADTWADRSIFVDQIELGAPPDALAPDGQNWAFPPMHPGRLAQSGYRAWRELLRAAFRHTGALRIDHILGLFRQFWIPRGALAAEGAYVRFPSEQLLGILALESSRAGAIVIGEDLGTVPPEVGPAIAAREVHSTRVLYFERGRGGTFRSSRSYPRRALATANTHDLIPLAGYWEGRDLELRRQVAGGECDAPGVAEQRAAERRLLLERLRAEKLLPSRAAVEAWSPSLCGAVHDFLHTSSARLVALSLDDLAGERDPVNLPGVGPDRYPSWRRRMALPLEQIQTDPAVRTALGRRARQRTVGEQDTRR